MKTQRQPVPRSQASRRGSRSAGLVLVLAALGLCLSSLVRGQEITEFDVPSGARPQGIAAGLDGNLWFTTQTLDGAGNTTATGVGRITTSGVVTEFAIPTPSGGALAITAGSDGNMWFTEGFANRIGRITPEGVITEFAIPTPNSLPQGIVAGPDGNIWFAEQSGNKIGRITPEGIVTGEFPIPTAGGNPGNIGVGPDGKLWFTEQATARIGRITTAGEITEFALPTTDAIPHGIVAGPDGNLWFVGTQGLAIGRITTAGVITEFPITPQTGGLAIAAGPDGNLWTPNLGPDLTRYATDGSITGGFEIPGVADTITAGPDGALWFTEPVLHRIGRITTGPCGANATTMCLGDGRFSVRASWQIPSRGTSGQGVATAISSKSGYFEFFGPGAIDMAVKLLDGCSINHHVWFFAGGLTNVEVTLTVEDTQDGGIRTYSSSAGTAFPPIQDTSAFATCP